MARRRANRRLERVMGIAIDLQYRIAGAEGGRAARGTSPGEALARAAQPASFMSGMDTEVLGRGSDEGSGVREDERIWLEASNGLLRPDPRGAEVQAICGPGTPPYNPPLAGDHHPVRPRKAR